MQENCLSVQGVCIWKGLLPREVFACGSFSKFVKESMCLWEVSVQEACLLKGVRSLWEVFAHKNCLSKRGVCTREIF